MFLTTLFKSWQWRDEGTRTLPLEHNTNKCCRPDLQINAKVNGQSFEEKQIIFVVSKYLPHKFPNHCGGVNKQLQILWYPSLQEASLIYLSWMWTRIGDLIPMNRVWKNKKSNSVVEKPGKHHTCGGVKVNIPSNKPCVPIMMKQAHIISVVPSPTSKPTRTYCLAQAPPLYTLQ